MGPPRGGSLEGWTALARAADRSSRLAISDIVMRFMDLGSLGSGGNHLSTEDTPDPT